MKTVLVIDDSKSIGEVVKLSLDRRAFRVDHVLDGLAAIDYLNQNPAKPDLILLDFDMPRMNGLSFRKLQLRNPEWAKIPTVLISGREDGLDDSQLPENRLPKPFQLTNLIDTVSRLAS